LQGVFDSSNSQKYAAIMKSKYNGSAKLNLLGQWLLEYVDEHKTPLTNLALQAGLSSSGLRYLVKESHRFPFVETCPRLANVTGRSAEEIFEMAGVRAPDGAAQFNPIRMEFLHNFDRLSPSLRSLLINMGRRLLDVV
jgi:hypothetical protein